MEFDSVIRKRHSTRSFTSKKVSWKAVLEAIDAALQAPFADNRCHLKFIVIENSQTIEKLAHFAEQMWIAEASIVVVVCSNDTNLENMHGERGRVYSRQQTGAAIENLLLKITEIDLSACWVGSYADELIRQTLNIPSHIQIEAIIPIGYEKEKVTKKRRASLENVLYWEQWDKEKRPALFQEGLEPHREM